MFEKTLLAPGSRELNWPSLFTFLLLLILKLALLLTAPNVGAMLLGGIGLALTLAGLRYVPVGSLGVPIFLGKRISGYVFTEGLVWAPPFVIEIRTTSATLRTLQIPPTECFTRDRARLQAAATLQYRPIDPSRIINIGDSEERALIATCQEALSRFLATHFTQQAISRQGSHVPVAHDLIGSWSRNYGIGGLRLQVTNVHVTDPAMNQAVQSRLLQQLLIPGDRIRNKHVASMMRQLTRYGLKPHQALDVIQVERGKANRTVQSYTFHGKPPIQFGGFRSRKGRRGGNANRLPRPR